MKSILTKVFALLLVACMLIPALVACKKDNNKPDDGNKDNTGDTRPVGNFTYNGALSTFPTNWNPLRYKTSTDGDVYDLLSNSFYEFTYNDTYDGYKVVSVMAVGDPEDVTDKYVGEKWGIEAGESGKAFRIKLNPDAKWENGDVINADSYIESFKRLLDPDLMNSRASNYYQGSYVIHNAKSYLYSGQEVILSDEGLEELESDEGLYIGLNNVSYLLDALSGSFGAAYSIKGLYEVYYGETYDAMAREEWAAHEADPSAELSVPGDYADVEAYVEAFFQYKMYGDGANDLRKAVAGLYDYIGAHAEQSGAKAGYAPIDDTLRGYAKLFSKALWGAEDNYLFLFSYVDVYPEIAFEDVGVQKVDDYTLDIVVDKALKGFYIKYSLGLPLVHIPTYDKLKVKDATSGAWSTTYNTSKDTTMSYGPYKMAVFMEDQEIRYVKNENWFGYGEKYEDVYGKFTRADGTIGWQYQTTQIVYKKAENISTREMMFNSGLLASLGLDADLLNKYKDSDNIYFAPGASTFYGIINSDYEKLREAEIALNGGNADSKQYNKTILSIHEFRQALSYALNRTELCAALYPAGSAAFGLFSNLIMADPENSIPFRSLDEAKQGMCEYWGVEWGEGKEFATLDQAYNAITGYNITEARRLIDVAVDKAIKAGYMDENSIVRITYCASSSSDTETKWYNTFNTMFTDLMKGTKLEGKFQYDSDFTLGNEFGDKIQSGACDTAWGFGWNGGELDPYDLIQVYVDGTASESPYQYDKWIDRSKITITLTLPEDGKSGAEKEMTYSILDWYYIVNGIVPEDGRKLPDWAFGNASDSVRAKVLAAMEKAILADCTTIPLMNQGGVQLRSYQINYGRDNYVFGMGFGGIRYTTYNFTDEEWTAFLAEHNNNLEDLYK